MKWTETHLKRPALCELIIQRRQAVRFSETLLQHCRTPAESSGEYPLPRESTEQENTKTSRAQEGIMMQRSTALVVFIHNINTKDRRGLITYSGKRTASAPWLSNSMSTRLCLCVYGCGSEEGNRVSIILFRLVSNCGEISSAYQPTSPSAPTSNISCCLPHLSYNIASYTVL